MTVFTSDEILRYASDIKSVLAKISENGLLSHRELLSWQQQLDAISDAVLGHIVRIAVVGAVKSGKSTLVNAFLGEDLLKRGAGIITSCVTRIRSGIGEKGGWVELKSWQEINDEITKTYKEFYLLGERPFPDKDRLDINLKEDRELLNELVQEIKKMPRSNRPVFDAQIMTLSSYLRGYNYMSGILDLDRRIKRVFNELSLHEHQVYTGFGDLWAFTKDVEILFPITWLGEGVEIADCQGADSPNPVHFTMLHEYLSRCHGVIYVIQSRVGLREADFKMLEVIKRLGLAPMTVIVFNIDIGEHDNIENFERLLEHTRKELSWLGYDVPVFSVAALAEMVKTLKDESKPAERDRILLWKNMVPELYCRSERDFTALKKYLRENVVDFGAKNFVERNYGRIVFVLNQIQNNIFAYREMLDLDIQTINSIVEDLKLCENMMKSTLGTFEKTIEEFSVSTINYAKQRVYEFFDPVKSPLMFEIADAIEGYHHPGYGNISDLRGLIRELYEFYISVREEIARIIAEKVGHKILEFAKLQEKYILERLMQTLQSFMSIFKVAFESYRKILYERLSFKMEPSSYEFTTSWEPKQDLYPPSLATFTQAHVLGKATLIMKFGIGKVIDSLSRFKDTLGRRRVRKSRSYRSKKLGDEAVELIKNEVKSEVEEMLEWYSERYIKEYLLPLLDDGINWLVREIKVRAEASMIDFHKVIEIVNLQGRERERQKRAFEEVVQRLDALSKTSPI